MKRILCSSLAMLLALGCLMSSGLQAGDKKKKDKATKDVVVEAELTNADVKDKVRMQSFCKTYTYKMTEGKTYQIDMKSKDIDSYLRLEDPQGTQVAFDDDGGGFPDARIVYKAPKGGDYTVICTTFGGGSTGKFTLTIKDVGGAPVGKDKKDAPPNGNAAPIKMTLDKDKGATYTGELAAGDALHAGKKLSKSFLFPMEAGKTYRIDLSSKAFDAYLYLEDPNGKIVDENDDNGESFDSRIIYKAEKAGTFRIIATSLSGTAMGKFTLTVKAASADEIKQGALLKKVNGLFNASAAERKDIVQEAVKYFEGKGAKVGQLDFRLAMGIGQVLEFAKDEKAAADAIKQFAKIFAKSDDATVIQQSKALDGMVRRLSLLGNAMEVKGKLVDGKDFDLKNLKGKVVLVDFWATWCGPCIAEIPHIKKMHEKYNKQGFEVIGISIDDNEDAAKKFLAKEGIPWGCIHDGDPRKGGGLADHYGIVSIPLAILVGRDGRVISMNARGEELTRLLDQQFEKK